MNDLSYLFHYDRMGRLVIEGCTKLLGGGSRHSSTVVHSTMLWSNTKHSFCNKDGALKLLDALGTRRTRKGIFFSNRGNKILNIVPHFSMKRWG